MPRPHRDEVFIVYGSNGPRPFREGLLEGKVALVTGGDSGISRGVCAVLSRLGAEVILTGSRVGGLDTWFRELTGEGGPVSGLDSDPQDAESMAELVEELETVHGRLDLLVTFAKHDEAGGPFEAVVEGLGTYCRTLQPLLARASGVIVNLVDTCCDETRTARTRPIDDLTRRLAGEWSRQGVRVCAVALGAVDTSSFERCPWEADGVEKPDVPLGRLGTTWEVGAIVAFLASDAAQFITGTTLIVDGGQRLDTPL